MAKKEKQEQEEPITKEGVQLAFRQAVVQLEQSCARMKALAEELRQSAECVAGAIARASEEYEGAVSSDLAADDGSRDEAILRRMRRGLAEASAGLELARRLEKLSGVKP